MKKILLCISVYLLSAYIQYPATAHNPSGVLSVTDQRIAEHMARVYGLIDFENGKALSYEIFSKAYRGYLNLKQAGKLSGERNILSVCDFSRSSNEDRLWIIDLDRNKVLYHTYVAHGQGSGEEFATVFSNRTNSHQSSIGFYVTGAIYEGEHGLSLRLHGMDNGYNSAAYDRGIVVHGAKYVCDDFIRGNQRLGRSWGCPAVESRLSSGIINTIRDSTCLFIYYPDKRYVASAYWLNKKVEHLPEDNFFTLPLAGTAPDPQAVAREVIRLDSFRKQGRYMPVIERQPY